MSAKKRMAALAITAVALLGSSPAFAGDMIASRTGVSAWSKGTNGQVAVKDTKADSRAAYANYHRRYNDNHELRNHSGSGTTVYSGIDTKNYVRALQACVAINFQPDDCTTWKYR
ncbi:hypothetical protein QNO07_01750 [Streptomyces sp. 549]|uniref:hypothetical protein n=1 Tax=Streptomyces sp. 549 TaxID=3049076 RepID=UPI0024C413C4|nr:hypothetical protein [Streptomyces sp. 549]MDK1472161.1 hypothetical protein [Streptomyces sp. 549]